MVDDDDAFRYLVAYHLHRGGFRALHAKPTAEARQLSPEDHPQDLLLTDFHLPEMNGLELAQWFQLHFPATKLVLICASATEAAAATGATGHHLCFISQTTPPDEVLAAVDALLAPLRARRAAAIPDAAVPPLTVLVVDDDDAMLILQKRFLEKQGYRVLLAADGPSAQKMAQTHVPIDLLMTDFKMPGMDGVQLARWFQTHFPQTKRLLISSGDPEFIGEAAGTADLPYVSKMAGFDAMVKMVGELLAAEKE